MGTRRTSIHLNRDDMKVLERLAKEETARTGSYVSAAQIIRRLIREHVLRARGKK